MKSVIAVTLVALAGTTNANAAEIYKCKTKEGGIVYSEFPCPGMPMKPISPGTVDLLKLSPRDVCVARDCQEAWINLSDPENKKSGVRISKQYHPEIKQNFEKLCPKFGFKLPVSSATERFNEELVSKL